MTETRDECRHGSLRWQCEVCTVEKEAEREAEQAAYWEKEADKMKWHAFRHKDRADRAEEERDTARQEAAKLRGGIHKALYHLGRSSPVTAQSALEQALHSSNQISFDVSESDAPASETEEGMGIDDALRLLDQLMYGDPSGHTHIENVPKLKEYVFNLRYDLAIAKRDLKRAAAPADRMEGNVTEALTCACGATSYFKTGECFACGTEGRSTDRPEPRQMDQDTADRLGERIRQARDSALSPSPRIAWNPTIGVVDTRWQRIARRQMQRARR